jgi:hypothetical protein
VAVTAPFSRDLARTALPISPHITQQALAGGGAAETVTVPADAWYVVFSASGDFALRVGGTAVFPVADVPDGTGSFLNPAYHYVVPASTFSLIAGTSSAVVTMAWYAMPPFGGN